MNENRLFFAGQLGDGYGWGFCNQQLLRELSRRVSVEFIAEKSAAWNETQLPGPFYNPIRDETMQRRAPARGTKNYGYTFFEKLLTPESKNHAAYYDLIFAGSTWNKQTLVAAGIGPVVVLLQGVDHQIFSPGPEQPADDRFYLFSGGKFELRKGQDLVLRAFQIFRQRHEDAVLITAWYNHWPASVRTMQSSPYLNFVMEDLPWAQFMAQLFQRNGLPPNSVRALPLLSQEKLADIYRKTHLGIFPNRAEGGTNLMLMEYMACGKPVIASSWTGHADVVNEDNAILLSQKKEMRIVNEQQKIVAHWYDASLEELVEKMEWAYRNRPALTEIGARAGQDLRAFTWGRAAETMLQHIEF